MKTKKPLNRGQKQRFRAYVAASVDGKIALKEKGKKTIDWTSHEDWKFLQDELAKADAVVVGRNTYDAYRDRLQKRNTFVLTSRVKKVINLGSVTFVNPKFADIEDLLADYRKVAILGAGSVYQFMLERNLLDELYVTIEPLLFGRGQDMFEGGEQKKENTKLKLLSVKKLNQKGTLLLRYEVSYS